MVGIFVVLGHPFIGGGVKGCGKLKVRWGGLGEDDPLVPVHFKGEGLPGFEAKVLPSFFRDKGLAFGRGEAIGLACHGKFFCFQVL